MNLTIASLTLWSPPKSTDSKKFLETLKRASYGHSWNQSMTVQLTKAGNYLTLLLISPTGEKQRAMCKFFLIASTNQFQQLSRVSNLPSALTFGLH
jgi:hypothetical protein